MISVRLKKFLDDNFVGYDVVQHDPAFTAQELAARMHVPGREFVKTVIVKLDGIFALAAVPAHRRVDLKALARVAGVRKAEIATEGEFQKFFLDCELGAMPPFGNLYEMLTFVDQEVAWNEVIVINAGTHAEAIRLRFGDLKRLVRPRIGSFAVPPPIERAAQRPDRGRAARPGTQKPRPKSARKKTAARKKAGRKAKASGKRTKAKQAKKRAKKKAARKKARGASRRKKTGKAAKKKPAKKRSRATGRKKSARKPRKKAGRARRRKRR